jgi:SAM-dependent methyltransferase
VISEAYAAPFGFEWDLHRHTQLDSASGTDRSRRTFAEKTGLHPSELQDRLVLDVGIGAGRFAEIALADGATVVGIDLSSAAEVAFRNLGGRARTAQADLFHAPFLDGTFDVVYSIGVLHHTPDTRAATRAVARLVKPGGVLAIWVYPTQWGGGASQLYRRWTTQMDERTLHRLSKAAALTFDPLRRLPIVGRAYRRLFPISGNRDRQWRILDTFDWYAPQYQWTHTRGEVQGWFEELGFEDIQPLDFPVAVRGSAPLAFPKAGSRQPSAK